MNIRTPRKFTSHLAAAKAEAAKVQKGLSDLLLHGLKDIYYAEKKLTVVPPKTMKAAQSQELINALSSHLDETHEHVKKVGDFFDLLNQPPKAVKCEAIDGIVAEAESILKEFSQTAAGDAAIIFSARRLNIMKSPAMAACMNMRKSCAMTKRPYC